MVLFMRQLSMRLFRGRTPPPHRHHVSISTLYGGASTARIIVTARSDGRGGFVPFARDASSHAGETVMVAGRPMRVSSDGRVNIPASVMRELGTPGPDGRYRVAAETGWRTDSGIARAGVVISRIPPRLAGEPTGGVVPRADAVTGTVIFPSDEEEFYFK